MGLERVWHGLRIFSIALSFFLITLQSYYFSNLGAAIFPIIGALTLCAVGILLPKNKEILNHFYFYASFAFFAVYYVVFSLFQYSDIKSIAAMLFALASIYGVIRVFQYDARVVVGVMTFVISLHLLFYFFQAFYWLFTKDYMDFLYPITGESQRHMSLKGLTVDAGRIPRFTGLFNEPGTYSNYVFIAALVRFAIIKKTDFLYYISAFSIASNFSLFGIVFSVLMVLLGVMNSRRFNLQSAIVLVISVVFMAFLFYPKISERLDSDYSGLEARQEVLSGLGEIDTYLYGRGDSNQDVMAGSSGLLAASLYHGGILEVFFLLVIALVISFRKEKKVSFILILIMLTKIKIAYPFLWLVMAVLFHAGERGDKSCQ